MNHDDHPELHQEHSPPERGTLQTPYQMTDYELAKQAMLIDSDMI